VVPSGNISFLSQLSNLEAGTKYYVVAFISDGSNTIYGNEINFTSGGFDSTDYWSSSEGSDYSAWTVSFTMGSEMGSDKSTMNRVRAIRTF
jgi:hypothetical protein